MNEKNKKKVYEKLQSGPYTDPMPPFGIFGDMINHDSKPKERCVRCASEKIKDIDKYNHKCQKCGFSWFFGPKEAISSEIKKIEASKFSLTEEEKKNIFNKLKDLLNNPNISIRTEGMNALLKYKYMWTGKNELQWYKITKDAIRILEDIIIENTIMKIE